MNYNLTGVVLPAGAHSIQLRFDDAAYERGKFITVVALVISLGLWGVGFVADRRRLVPGSAAT